MGPWLTAGLNLLTSALGIGGQSWLNQSQANQQNRYNSPAAQMQRYKMAGLNPNLIYSQGNPGNMTPLPTIDVQGAVGNQGTKVQQAEYLEEQTGLASEKRKESKAKQSVLAVQKEVLAANPYLNADYVKSFVQAMISTAQQKQHDTDFLTGKQTSTGLTTQGQAKMVMELNRIAQQFEIGSMDLQMKAKLLQNQDFLNAITEAQKKFIVDGSINSQTMMEGIKMLLMFLK